MTTPRTSRPTVQPPAELIAAVSERRLIPFVGAGFSSSLGLPNWDTLLSNLASELSLDLSYSELKENANNDFLQIAEYLYIKSDRRIGPLRHVIERGLNVEVDALSSDSHIELANLGAPQVYTTNYDSLLETAYRSLGLDYSVVALPKDVANQSNDSTQIIKYHGDLRHESTLVLTESSYYKRLDFESPMDLKFRSDLLGRSVLYMGYSFRDINIRLIWFKLMQMMQDIPSADRRPSYIVRFTPNPVLEELYRDVGLQTIVLDPSGDSSEEEWTGLLSAFLARLATMASPSANIPGTSLRQFASTGLMEQIAHKDPVPSDTDFPFDWQPATRGAQSARRFLMLKVPKPLRDLGKAAFDSYLSGLSGFDLRTTNGLTSKADEFGPSTALTNVICKILRGGNEFASIRARQQFIARPDLPWPQFWGAPISDDVVTWLVREIRKEVAFNEDDNADLDIAYCVDLAIRLRLGFLTAEPLSDDLMSELSDLIERASNLYPAVRDYEPKPDKAPSLSDIVKQIEARAASLPPDEPNDPFEDPPPF